MFTSENGNVFKIFSIQKSGLNRVWGIEGQLRSLVHNLDRKTLVTPKAFSELEKPVPIFSKTPSLDINVWKYFEILY